MSDTGNCWCAVQEKADRKTFDAPTRLLWETVNSAVASFSEHPSWWGYRLNPLLE